MLTKDLDSLENILESVEKIELYSSQLKTADNLFNDAKSFDAIMMNFIIIGEMVIKLSDGFKEKNSDIEWWKIKGFRMLHMIILALTQKKCGKSFRINSLN